MQTYNYNFTAPIHDIDAAGVIFFAHFFRHAHDAYEAFMSDIGFSLDKLIREKQLLPLINSEADFQQPIRHGDNVSIQLQIKRIGNSSFTVNYRFLGQQNQQFATASTTHVYLDKDGRKSRALPEALRTELSKYLAAG
ncbi:MAG: thioesterase family protein [Pseudomonadota bacterium]|nr:thioesterase family protein [Pseudomonadota bacterium]